MYFWLHQQMEAAEQPCVLNSRSCSAFCLKSVPFISLEGVNDRAGLNRPQPSNKEVGRLIYKSNV